MIVADRFPTTYSDSSYPLYEYERTELITTLGDGFKNYWLGYMNFDVIPSVFFASELLTSTNGVSARRVNSQQNSPVGYTTDSYGYGAYQSAYIKETGFTPTNNYNCYLNSMHARAYGTQFNFSTGNDAACQLAVMIETGNNENLGLHQSYTTKILSGDDPTTTGLISFLQGQRDMSLTHTINGVTVTHILTSEDLENNGIVVFTGNANGTYYKLSVFIAGYGFTPFGAHDSSDTNNRVYHISPTLKLYSEYGNYYVMRTNGIYLPSYTRVDVNTGQFYLTGNPGNIAGIGLLGGFEFNFSLADLQALANFDFIYNGNTVAYKLSGVAQLLRVYKPSDVLHHFALIMRIPSNLSYGYIPGVYCPEVLEDGEFTGNLLTGTLTEDDVRPWQWGNITSDDFKEDDIPPYTPGGDDAENIGDKITRPASIGVGGTNGFVTQYALNRADVAQLGALLWTSFVDQDYWQNYLFSLALDTGTFQLSGLLNFFVSLKVYPFPLINIDSFSQWGADMYIGTGIVPLHFNNPLHVINNYCDYISGGYIDIPRYFNDYRDYINTEISLYLPFCGTVQLNPGDVIGNRIDIEYAIDFATGGCIAYVDLTTGDGAGYPVGALPGQIGADIPLTATAAGEVAARFIGDGLNVAGMIGGEVSRTASGVAGALGGNPSGGSGGGSIFAGVAGMYGGAGAAMAADLAPGLARQGLQMLQRGAVGAPMLSGGRGFAAFGAPSKPYVQIRRGIYPEVSGLGTVLGLPAAGTYTIGSLSGFVQGYAKVDGLSCPDNEKQKIRALLASGIYV